MNVNSYDIFPAFLDANAYPAIHRFFLQYSKALEIDVVVGMDARGFLFAPHLAATLNAGFAPIR